MFHLAFKKLVRLREKIALDLDYNDVEKPFFDHLEDFRSTIIRIAVTLLVMMSGVFFFAKELLALLLQPLKWAGLGHQVNLVGLKITDWFMTAVNLSLVAGIILAFPLLLFFILQFLLPGLRSNEKKVLFPALVVGGGLFLIGICLAYFLVMPRMLIFFYEFSADLEGSFHGIMGFLPMPGAGAKCCDACTCIPASFPGATPATGAASSAVAVAARPFIWTMGISDYVKFVAMFILLFGACFELPVVIMALVKLDVLSYRVMKTTRAWAAVIIAVVAALITPTADAYTLILLAVPMYVLYEICIWIAWWLEKKDRKLYPEYYKEQDEAAKDIEVAEDWDNENYNPWNAGSNDDEEEGRGMKPDGKPGE